MPFKIHQLVEEQTWTAYPLPSLSGEGWVILNDTHLVSYSLRPSGEIRLGTTYWYSDYENNG